MFMKLRNPLIHGNLLAAALWLSVCPIQAGEWVRFRAQPSLGKVKIDGTSTVHDWTMQSKLVPGYLEFEQGFQLDPALKPGSVKAQGVVTMPVRQFHGNWEGMDKVMYETMKTPPNTNIVYRLTELVLTKVPTTADGAYEFQTKGELAIAGVTNVISMPVRMERMEGNKIKTTGTTDLKMTAFGMKPPSPTFLPIKTGDDVKITFEWVVAPPASGAKS